MNLNMLLLESSTSTQKHSNYQLLIIGIFTYELRIKMMASAMIRQTLHNQQIRRVITYLPWWLRKGADYFTFTREFLSNFGFRCLVTPIQSHWQEVFRSPFPDQVSLNLPSDFDLKWRKKLMNINAIIFAPSSGINSDLMNWRFLALTCALITQLNKC